MSPSEFSAAVRRIVKLRSMGRCEVCGTPALSGDMHHRLPRGLGGSRDPVKGRASNALWLCRVHHRLCESNRREVFDNGWKLRHGQSPVDVPALLVTAYGRGVWLLDDDGAYLPWPIGDTPGVYAQGGRTAVASPIDGGKAGGIW